VLSPPADPYGRPAGVPGQPPSPAGKGHGAGSAVAAVVAATALFGTVGTARVLGPEASSWSVGAVRLAAGALALVGIARWAGAAWPALSALFRVRATWWAGAGMAAFQGTFLAAVELTGVAAGTLLAIGSAPLFTGILAGVVTRRWLATTALALAGLALLVAGGGEGGGLSGRGAALALAAGLSYAIYTVASKAQVRAGHSPAGTAAASFTVAALLLAPALVLTDLAWLRSAGGAAMATYLALGPTATSYVLFARGLRRLPAGTVSTLGLTEPVVAAVLGVAVLGERLAPLGVVGGLLVLAALAVLARATVRAAGAGGPEPAEQSPP
jgi:drug/metabolite transporter, DME family